MTAAPHRPVMAGDVVAALAPRDGGLYVDGTFGAGGYSRALLDAADCTVWAIDRDPHAVREGAALAARHPGRLTILEGRFGDLLLLLSARGITAVDGVTFDLGVSSMQIDRPERGFSFRHDGPLDMRMGSHGPSAADVVNEIDEGELADILYRYGEERRSRRVAKAIAAARSNAPITRTLALAEIVRSVLPPAADGIHPATRTFQALRIYVNDELGELARGLAGAEALLREGGRLAVVSFHSLEDRIVKTFLRERSGRTPEVSRHAPQPQAETRLPSFRLIGNRPQRPGASEVADNPRARSARLRTAERTAAPAWTPAGTPAGIPPGNAGGECAR